MELGEVMNLQEILETVVGQFYWEGVQGSIPWHNMASVSPVLSIHPRHPEISIRFGSNEEYEEVFDAGKIGWSFPDNKIYMNRAEVLLNGSVIIERTIYCVDGRRAYLPSPNSSNEVTYWDRDFASLIDSFHKNHQFNEYFQRTGMVAS